MFMKSTYVSITTKRKLNLKRKKNGLNEEKLIRGGTKKGTKLDAFQRKWEAYF